MNPKWDSQLKVGEDAELELLNHIKVVYPAAYRTEGNFKDFDIFVNEFNCIELKHDVMSTKTGNFAFEVHYLAKPEGSKERIWIRSGIAATKANWFVVLDYEKYYFFNSEKLLDYIKTNWHTIIKKLGGDDFRSQLCLIPKIQIINQSFSTPLMRGDFNYNVLKMLCG